MSSEGLGIAEIIEWAAAEDVFVESTQETEIALAQAAIRSSRIAIVGVAVRDTLVARRQELEAQKAVLVTRIVERDGLINEIDGVLDQQSNTAAPKKIISPAEVIFDRGDEFVTLGQFKDFCESRGWYKNIAENAFTRLSRHALENRLHMRFEVTEIDHGNSDRNERRFLNVPVLAHFYTSGMIEREVRGFRRGGKHLQAIGELIDEWYRQHPDEYRMLGLPPGKRLPSIDDDFITREDFALVGGALWAGNQTPTKLWNSLRRHERDLFEELPEEFGPSSEMVMLSISGLRARIAEGKMTLVPNIGETSVRQYSRLAETFVLPGDR